MTGTAAETETVESMEMHLEAALDRSSTTTTRRAEDDGSIASARAGGGREQILKEKKGGGDGKQQQKLHQLGIKVTHQLPLILATLE
mmetsp:Transcript_38687/g.43175  ORF Transcript_38687/g.43175 Transcript_38687/m.43175 type:complete len:87 (-) Transcript_38687:418-678(-)